MKTYWLWTLWLFCCCLFQAQPWREKACMSTAKNQLRLSRWRSWLKHGNTGFRMSLATGVFSALSCLSDCLQDQKETVINIRFSQLWLASNLWHFNVLQEITSNTHIHTCSLINTLFSHLKTFRERRKTECQWKSFTLAVTHRNTHKVKPQALCTEGSDRKWLWLTGILNSCYHEGFCWWKGYYPIPPMHWKNESSGIECAVTTLESHMLYISPKSFVNEFQRCLHFGGVSDL